MPNDVQGFIPKLWSKRTQLLKKRKSVIYAVGNFEERSTLTFGSEVVRPVMLDDLEINPYIRGKDAEEQGIKTTPETLKIDFENEIMVYIDKHDEKQSKYTIEKLFTERASHKLSNNEDAKFLEEVLFAEYLVDDGGNGFTVNKNNVSDVVSEGKNILSENDVEDDVKWVAVFPSKVCGAIELATINGGFNLADTSLKNGYAGNFLGIDVHMSNNLPHLTEISTPANSNTLTIGGVKITFKGTITTAGDVKVGADLTETVANANKILLGAKEDSSTGRALSKEDRKKIKKKRAKLLVVDGKIFVFTSGKSTISTTGITAKATHCYGMIGQKGTIDAVLQEFPDIQKNKVANRTGYNFLATDLCGFKAFKEGRERMAKVKFVA